MRKSSFLLLFFLLSDYSFSQVYSNAAQILANISKIPEYAGNSSNNSTYYYPLNNISREEISKKKIKSISVCHDYELDGKTYETNETYFLDKYGNESSSAEPDKKNKLDKKGNLLRRQISDPFAQDSVWLEQQFDEKGKVVSRNYFYRRDVARSRQPLIETDEDIFGPIPEDYNYTEFYTYNGKGLLTDYYLIYERTKESIVYIWNEKGQLIRKFQDISKTDRFGLADSSSSTTIETNYTYEATTGFLSTTVENRKHYTLHTTNYFYNKDGTIKEIEDLYGNENPDKCDELYYCDSNGKTIEVDKSENWPFGLSSRTVISYDTSSTGNVTKKSITFSNLIYLESTIVTDKNGMVIETSENSVENKGFQKPEKYKSDTKFVYEYYP
jgi:hypothetical protein